MAAWYTAQVEPFCRGFLSDPTLGQRKLDTRRGLFYGMVEAPLSALDIAPPSGSFLPGGGFFDLSSRQNYTPARLRLPFFEDSFQKFGNSFQKTFHYLPKLPKTFHFLRKILHHPE
jgi:hypothetical protein